MAPAPSRFSAVAALGVLCACISSAHADIYMHNPRGSNDRNCERNVNRNNGNRLFDSQNNAKGGYACPRATAGPGKDNNDLRQTPTGTAAAGLKYGSSKMYYYEGSVLPIEWTNQHGCGEGNDKLRCEIILQYGCETDFDPDFTYSSDPASAAAAEAAKGGGLASARGQSFVGAPRDGIPRDANDAATETIPLNDESAQATTIESRRYAMHETLAFYQSCKARERNKGLFTADQKVKRRDATGTRQNPNGNRRGLECPEERDYYPYWAPTPWVDIAALVSNPMRCHGYCSDDTNLAISAPPTPAPPTAAPTTTAGRRLPAGDAATTTGGNPSWWKAAADGSGRAFTYTGAIRNGDQKISKAYREQYERYKTACRNQDGVEWVDGILAESQNEKGAGKCACTGNDNANGKCPNNEAGCLAKNFQWTVVVGGKGRPAPECVVQEFSRVNHLGNGDAGYTGDAVRQAIRTRTSVNEAFKVAGLGATGGVDDTALRAGLGVGTGLTPEAAAASLNNAAGEEKIAKWEADGKGTGNANRYMWKLPAGLQSHGCALRIRYNITTFDYAVTADATVNGKDKSPVTQDPYVTIGNLPTDFLSMALNTNQYGRTFQDRSYAFAVLPKPTAAAKEIYNLNVRGKRGNIVQTYPAVEYDFTPNVLQTEVGDHVHFQWTGSDYNPRRGCNNGEGGPPDPPDSVDAAKKNSRADRSNVVPMNLVGENLPTTLVDSETDPDTAACTGSCCGKSHMQCLEDLCDPAKEDVSLCNSMFKKAGNKVDGDTLWRLMFLGQDTAAVNPGGCLTETELDAIKNKNQRENHPRNCAKLNSVSSPYFDGALAKMSDTAGGRFHYYSSRNNNFSNRDQTGTVCVKTSAGDSSATNSCDKADPKFRTELSSALAKVASGQRAKYVKQLPSDQKIPDGIIVDGDTFEGDAKDNDALGDGDQEGCEAMVYDFFKGIGPGGVAALAVGLLATGSLLTLLGLYVVTRYRRRHKETAGKDDDASESRAWLNPPVAKM